MAVPSLAFVGTALMALSAAAAVVRRRMQRWAGAPNAASQAAVRVTIGPLRDGTQDVELLLYGTTRAHHVVRFDVDRDDAARCGLTPPAGFAAAAVEGAGHRLAWTPASPPGLVPGVPLRVAFGVGEAEAAPAIVGVRIARPEGHGDGLLLFGVRLPVRDERVRHARNLRSALMQRARERAVLPRELPEWSDLMALEREIAR